MIMTARWTSVTSSEVGAADRMDAEYWVSQREVTEREAALAGEDERGQPYFIPPAWREGWRMDYAGAVAIARSRHPKRVLANTSGYRYGYFEERADGVVVVHMMGQHIASFHPNAVELWWRGYVTVTSTEALSNLCEAGSFYAEKRKIIFAPYGGRSRVPAIDGDSYHYGRA
jgi:hypothetical protein